MTEKRFYFACSTVYGWCVYDRETQTPAYDVCSMFVRPKAPDCTMLKNADEASHLARLLNAYAEFGVI